MTAEQGTGHSHGFRDAVRESHPSAVCGRPIPVKVVRVVQVIERQAAAFTLALELWTSIISLKRPPAMNGGYTVDAGMFRLKHANMSSTHFA